MRNVKLLPKTNLCLIIKHLLDPYEVNGSDKFGKTFVTFGIHTPESILAILIENVEKYLENIVRNVKYFVRDFNIGEGQYSIVDLENKIVSLHIGTVRGSSILQRVCNI